MAPAVIATPAPEVVHSSLSVQREDHPVRENAGVEGQVRNQTLQRRNRAISWGGKEKALCPCVSTLNSCKSKLAYETPIVNKSQSDIKVTEIWLEAESLLLGERYISQTTAFSLEVSLSLSL